MCCCHTSDEYVDFYKQLFVFILFAHMYVPVHELFDTVQRLVKNGVYTHIHRQTSTDWKFQILCDTSLALVFLLNMSQKQYALASDRHKKTYVHVCKLDKQMHSNNRAGTRLCGLEQRSTRIGLTRRMDGRGWTVIVCSASIPASTLWSSDPKRQLRTSLIIFLPCASIVLTAMSFVFLCHFHGELVVKFVMLSRTRSKNKILYTCTSSSLHTISEPSLQVLGFYHLYHRGLRWHPCRHRLYIGTALQCYRHGHRLHCVCTIYHLRPLYNHGIVG